MCRRIFRNYAQHQTIVWVGGISQVCVVPYQCVRVSARWSFLAKERLRFEGKHKEILAADRFKRMSLQWLALHDKSKGGHIPPSIDERRGLLDRAFVVLNLVAVPDQFAAGR